MNAHFSVVGFLISLGLFAAFFVGARVLPWKPVRIASAVVAVLVAAMMVWNVLFFLLIRR